jgi:hypothetical protein
MNTTKAEFLKYPDTDRLLTLIRDLKIPLFASGYDLDAMCSTATARRDALEMLHDLNVDLTESYDAVMNSDQILRRFIAERNQRASDLTRDISNAYGSLAEICARALISAVKETPQYSIQINRMKQFCKLIGSISNAHKIAVRANTDYENVLHVNRRSLQALSAVGFSEGGYQEAKMLEAYSKINDRDWIAVYRSGADIQTTYFSVAVGNPIHLNYAYAYLGYDNRPDDNDGNFSSSRAMTDYVGAFRPYSRNHYYKTDGACGMFAFFPFEEDRSTVNNKKMTFLNGEKHGDWERILCNDDEFLEIFDTHPYRVFALAELCLHRILIRERGAMLNMVQSKRASDTLQSLISIQIKASSLYTAQKNARIDAEAAREAAKTVKTPTKTPAKKIKVVKVTPKPTKTAKTVNTPKK